MRSDRPSIILITADQLRKNALGCYGGRAVATPHIDRLASTALRFDRAYTNSPWCLPSRCAILTGTYPHTNGAHSNFRDGRLDPALPNLYNVLGAHGYKTAHIGKCHFAPVPYGETKPDRTLPYDDFRAYYLKLGMDHLDLQDDKQVSVWFFDDYAKELERAGYLEAYRSAVWNREARKVFEFPGPAQWHPDAWVGRRAAQFIESYEGDRPLFLWVSFSGPHFPFDPPGEYLARVRADQIGEGAFLAGEFDDVRRIHHTSYHGGGGIEGAASAPQRGCRHYSDTYWRELRRNYFANIALIDDQVGMILHHIEHRFGDSCMVIFTADHGEMLGNHRLWGKHNCAYEDVLNVPLIVRFPGETGGASTAAMSMLIDIMPTCLNAAGITSQPKMDGTDLRTVVEQGGHDYVLSEGGGFAAISDGVHKYVCVVSGGRTHHELFDLSRDPHEFHNFADDPGCHSVRTKLHEALTERLVGALLP